MHVNNGQSLERAWSQVMVAQDYTKNTNPDIITAVPSADEAAAMFAKE
jgi:hypothetical protein